MKAPGRAQELHEDFILASDRRLSPLTVGVVAATDTQLSADQLRVSLHRALTRRPVVSTFATAGREGFTGWEAPPEESRSVGLIREIAVGPHSGRGLSDDPAVWQAVRSMCSDPFDLRAELPLRVLLAHRPTGAVVGLVAHHVLLDGISVLTLLREILAGCEVEPGRSLPGSAAAGSSAVAVWPASGGAAGDSTARPQAGRGRVTRHLVPCGPRRARGYEIHSVTLPALPAVPAMGGRRATANDLLIAAAHLAVEGWNAERGRSTGTVTVRMPLDAAVSAGADDSRVLGNRSGQAMITSSPAERAAPRLLTARTVEQTAAAKQDRSQWAGAGLMSLATVVLARAPRPLRAVALRLGAAAVRPYLAPSVAVSNIGRSEAGPRPAKNRPRITDLSFVATNGMPQGLLIGVARTGGSMRVSFCYHRRMFDSAGAARFAEIYRESLATLISAAGAGDPIDPPQADAAVGSARRTRGRPPEGVGTRH